MENQENKSVPKKNTRKPAPEKNTEAMQRTVLTYLHDLTCLLAGVLLVFSLCFRVVVVSGPSMNNTLLDGDWLLLIGNLFYGDPEYGDIIVASKDSFKDGEPIIKRVIATEGQTVDIDFNAGIVYVDSVALDESYILTPTTTMEGVEFPITVDEGCVFVMGDNRGNSKDSRSNEIGQIDCREILGRAVFVLFPGTNKDTVPREFDRIGVLS